MNLTISGHHLDITPALREYVIHKLERITRHFDQVVDVKVLLSVDPLKDKDLRQKAECNIHVKGRDLFAESAHADFVRSGRPVGGQARPAGAQAQRQDPRPPSPGQQAHGGGLNTAPGYFGVNPCFDLKMGAQCAAPRSHS